MRTLLKWSYNRRILAIPKDQAREGQIFRVDARDNYIDENIRQVAILIIMADKARQRKTFSHKN